MLETDCELLRFIEFSRHEQRATIGIENLIKCYNGIYDVELPSSEIIEKRNNKCNENHRVNSWINTTTTTAVTLLTSENCIPEICIPL